MMKNNEESLPTDFAITLLEECGFIENPKNCANTVKLHKMRKLIGDFQRMSICASFQDSIVAFHGIEITGLQNEVLQVIYKSTKPWIMGLTIGACLDAIQFKTLARNEFSDALKTLVEQVSQKDPANTGKRMKGILVNVVKRDS